MWAILWQDCVNKNQVTFMCELNVILLKDSTRQMVMESVTKVMVEGDSIELTGILGDRTNLKGFIRSIDFSKGEIVILSK
jgi:predicted RNA-binding protein